MKLLKSIIVLIGTLLMGFAISAFLIWNPARWEWATHFITHFYRFSSQTMHQRQTQIGKSAAEPKAEKKKRKIKYWRAPMNPNYISDKPGKSPMGMDLVPVYEDEESAERGVRVNPNFVQNFAIRTTVAEKGTIPIEIRTIGILNYNQKNIISVNTKFEGWIENPRVNYIGQKVRQGEILFEIYSPELVSTQKEFLTDLEYVENLSSCGSCEALRGAESLLKATRERLRYWDITDMQIAQLRHAKIITKTLKVVSSVSGIVIEKMGESLEGMRLTPGMNVYKIADLSTIWAEIEVFEYQIQHVSLGQVAEITVDAFPSDKWEGKIIYIDPTVNQRTRTLKVYVEIPNPYWKLRPKMYANVVISVPALSEVLKIPDQAILHTGEKNVVIVRKDHTLFEPRDVILGVSSGGYTEVLSGLESGEQVVTSSQFLIDSESNLNEALSAMLTSMKGKKKQGVSSAPMHMH